MATDPSEATQRTAFAAPLTTLRAIGRKPPKATPKPLNQHSKEVHLEKSHALQTVHPGFRDSPATGGAH